MGKVYAIALLVILSGCSVYYAYIKPFPTHHSMFDKPTEGSQIIEKTWNEYLDCCSGEKIIEN